MLKMCLGGHDSLEHFSAAAICRGWPLGIRYPVASFLPPTCEWNGDLHEACPLRKQASHLCWTLRFLLLSNFGLHFCPGQSKKNLKHLCGASCPSPLLVISLIVSLMVSQCPSYQQSRQEHKHLQIPKISFDFCKAQYEVHWQLCQKCHIVLWLYVHKMRRLIPVWSYCIFIKLRHEGRRIPVTAKMRGPLHTQTGTICSDCSRRVTRRFSNLQSPQTKFNASKTKKCVQQEHKWDQRHPWLVLLSTSCLCLKGLGIWWSNASGSPFISLGYVNHHAQDKLDCWFALTMKPWQPVCSLPRELHNWNRR